MSSPANSASRALSAESAGSVDYVLVEPQCVGFEHAKVNTAFVVGFCKRVEDGHRVLLFCQDAHWREIEPELGTVRAQVMHKSILVPRRDARGYGRILLEWLCIRSIKRRMPSTDSVKRMIFLSGTAQTLVALRLSCSVARNWHPTVILHSILETLLPTWRTKAVWELPISLRNVLKYGFARHVDCAVLGERILRNLSRIPGAFLPHARWTDIPCWPLPPKGSEAPDLTVHPITLGAIGVGHRAKGTDLLFQLAKTLEGLKDIRIVLIGYVKDGRIRASAVRKNLALHSRAALSSSEMRLAVSGLQYALFLFRPGTYVLTETGSFLDAVSCGKPVIALRSDMMEEKFRRFGNIGYMGESLEDIAEIIRRIVKCRPVEEYRTQTANMVRAASLLQPELCADRLIIDQGAGAKGLSKRVRP